MKYSKLSKSNNNLTTSKDKKMKPINYRYHILFDCLDIKKAYDKNQKIHKENPDLFVKKWIKSQYAYFFLLSNDKVQIIFEDKSQIIFDFFQKKICFINKMKENSIYNIENTRFENESIEQKVKYVKRILKKIS